MAKLSFEVLSKAKKSRIIKELDDYGIEKLPYLLVRWGKRLRIFSGSIEREMIFKLFREINIDSIGLYFASIEQGIRLSTDALHILSKQIKKGIIELDGYQAEQWFSGRDIELSDKQKKDCERLKSKFIILRNRDDFIGVGKKSSYGIANFMPKERRIKK